VICRIEFHQHRSLFSPHLLDILPNELFQRLFLGKWTNFPDTVLSLFRCCSLAGRASCFSYFEHNPDTVPCTSMKFAFKQYYRPRSAFRLQSLHYSNGYPMGLLISSVFNTGATFFRVSHWSLTHYNGPTRYALLLLV